MSQPLNRARRRFLMRAAATAPVIAAGTAAHAFASPPGLELPFYEAVHYRAHRLLIGDALAREYDRSEISEIFPPNGSTEPDTEYYLEQEATGFANWELTVDGLCAAPRTFTLAELRALPSRTQITRHDCVEGWSAIGEWKGARLSALLDLVKPMQNARYVVLHCSDRLLFQPYYESIDMVDAYHEQTILAYDMNGKELPKPHGAPIRLRVERQLGYKHAKFVERIELTDSMLPIHKGKGGFWEDFDGYEWYAGL